MPSSASAIISELLRVSSSLYAASLKPLHDALNHNNKSYLSDLSAFAERYPCQISSLCHALVSALEYCPFGQLVFEKVARERKIRDGILGIRRNILDVLLKSALGNERGWSKYNSMCLVLLSHPLPKEIAPPALLAKFFLRWVELFTTLASGGEKENKEGKEASGPGEEALMAIYTLARAGHGGFLECLSLQQRNMLFGRLKKYVVSTGQKVTLLSLATLGMLNKTVVSGGSEEQEVTTADDLFNGSKTERMLQLVCLNVKSGVSTDKDGAETDMEEVKETIEFARNIVQATDLGKREEYVRSEERKQLLKDSLARAQGRGDGMLLMEVMKFVMEISNGKMPSGATDIIYQHLRNTMDEARFKTDGFGITSTLVPGCIGEILSRDSPPQDIIRDLLLSSLSLCSVSLPSDSSAFPRLAYRISFLQALTPHIHASCGLRSAIFSCLMTSEFSKPLERFTTCADTLPVPPVNDCSKIEACSTKIWNLQRQLSINLCILVLTTGIYSNSIDTSDENTDRSRDNRFHFDCALATSFLDLHGKLSSLPSTPCPSETPQSPKDRPSCFPNISILEQSCTPSSRLTSYSWRQKILSELQGSAARQHQSLITAMGEICRDLESRCEIAEKPIRDEQEKVSRLVKEVETMKIKFKETKELLDGRNATLQELDSSKEHMERQLDVALERLQEAESRCEELEKELEKEKLERKEEWKRSKREADMVAAEHLRILSERMERIGGLDETRLRLETMTEELKKQVDSLREEVENINQEKTKSDERTVWLDGELAAALSKVYKVEEKSEQLAIQVKERNEFIQEKEQELQSYEDRIAKKEREFREIIKQKEKTMDDLNSLNDLLLEKKTEIDSLSNKVVELEKENKQKDEEIVSLQRNRQDLSSEVTSLKSRLDQLEETNTKLNKTISNLESTLERMKTESAGQLQLLQSVTSMQLETLKAESKARIESIILSNNAQISALEASFSKSRETRDKEKGRLEKEIKIWQMKWKQLQTIQEKREREFRSASELSRKLLATIQAVGLVGAGSDVDSGAVSLGGDAGEEGEGEDEEDEEEEDEMTTEELEEIGEEEQEEEQEMDMLQSKRKLAITKSSRNLKRKSTVSSNEEPPAPLPGQTATNYSHRHRGPRPRPRPRPRHPHHSRQLPKPPQQNSPSPPSSSSSSSSSTSSPPLTLPLQCSPPQKIKEGNQTLESRPKRHKTNTLPSNPVTSTTKQTASNLVPLAPGPVLAPVLAPALVPASAADNTKDHKPKNTSTSKDRNTDTDKDKENIVPHFSFSVSPPSLSSSLSFLAMTRTPEEDEGLEGDDDDGDRDDYGISEEDADADADGGAGGDGETTMDVTL